MTLRATVKCCVTVLFSQLYCSAAQVLSSCPVQPQKCIQLVTFDWYCIYFRVSATPTHICYSGMPGLLAEVVRVHYYFQTALLLLNSSPCPVQPQPGMQLVTYDWCTGFEVVQHKLKLLQLRAGLLLLSCGNVQCTQAARELMANTEGGEPNRCPRSIASDNGRPAMTFEYYLVS